MTPEAQYLLWAIATIVLILALAYDNRHHRHIWRDRDEDD